MGMNGHSNGIKLRDARMPGEKRKTAPSPKGLYASRKQQNMGKTSNLTTFIVENQIKLSLLIMQCLATAWFALPGAQDTVEKFIFLSYRNPKTGLYLKGVDDLYVVAFWIVFFTFLRVVVMDYVLMPYARSHGIKTQKGAVRFAEQGWACLYATVFWSLGMYIMYTSEYWWDIGALWRDWPVREVTGLMKWYYLAQYAFWVQQIFVLHIEERRKDHYQMLAHHIITCALMVGSYMYHFTRVGNAILCLMDVVDILLPAAKMLKYLNYQIICDVMFGIFMLVWFIGRHVLFNIITFSLYNGMSGELDYGCNSWQDDATIIESSIWGGTDETCWTPPIRRTFLSLLILLQIITIAWFFMICRVAAKVLRGGVAEDTRSDDEEELDEDPISNHKKDLADRDRMLLEKIGKESLRNVSTGCSGIVSNGNLSGGGVG